MSSERSPLMYGRRGEGRVTANEANGEYDRASEGIRTSCASECTKSFVFGGFDGIVAALAIISGAAGGTLAWKSVLILGLSSMLANAISLGISEFLSSKAHREYIRAEKRREMWEFKHYRDVEILEMTNRFVARGMERKDAELVVSKMAQYENFFVGLMVVEELGLQLPEDDDAVLITDAFVMCISFAFFGCIPLVIFCLGPLDLFSQDTLYIAAVITSLVLLCVLAIVKSSFSSATAFHAAVEALCVGVVCSGFSYAVGAGVKGLLS